MKPLLAEAMPELAREVEDLLLAAGEGALAAQVERLEIVGRCRCATTSAQPYMCGPSQPAATA